MRTWARRLSLAFIFTVPWESALVWGLGTLSRTAGLAVAGLWFGAVLYSRRFRRIGRFHVLAVAFLIWTAVSVLWSVDVEITVGRLISTVQMVVLVILVWDLYRTPSEVRQALQAYVLGAFVIVGILISTFLKDPDVLRYQALGTTANGTGVILALGIPFAWYLATSTRPTFAGRLWRALNYAYIPLAAFGIALTATRFVMIMAVPGMLFGIASLSRLRLGWRVVVFLAVCGVLLWLPAVVPERSLERLGTVDEEIASGDLNRRTVFWREGIDLWKASPLTGLGAATFESISRSGRSAHNSFIALLAELGLVGVLVYGMIWMNALHQAWTQPRWEARFWLTVLVVLFIANSALTMSHTKVSWLVFGLLATAWGASAAEPVRVEVKDGRHTLVSMAATEG